MEARIEPRKILLISPDFFEVRDVKNIHMDGHVGLTNQKKARDQWDELKNTYGLLVAEEILEEVLVLKGRPGCEDMVFCANPGFPWIDERGEKIWIAGKMRHPSRQQEVEPVCNFLKNEGYKIIHLKTDQVFEGMGDLIPHPAERKVYGGYGFRTNSGSFAELEKVLDAQVIPLRLVNEKFYHLDTCFLPLSSEQVMICKEAFDQKGLDAISENFENVIQVSEEEASNHFALNAHIIYPHKIAVIHTGAEKTAMQLEGLGFRVIRVDTSEYLKAGGSVFCMKMGLY